MTDDNAFLIISDSNLKFQSLSLLLNIFETQKNKTQVFVFYVYDNLEDKNQYENLLVKMNATFTGIVYSGKTEVFYISKSEVDRLTTKFSIYENSYITRTAFLRLFMARWLPQHLEKVLYLDIDILIKEEIEELFDLSFDTPIFAEICTPKFLSNGGHLENFNAPYFNSGVMLINLPKWREMNLESRFVDYGSKATYTYLDQDILNLVFKDNWTRLGRPYNYFHRYGSGEIDSDFSLTPKVIHFVGNKPWKDTPITQYVSEYRNKFNRIRILDMRLSDGE